jgi:adenylate cyclase class IV
MSRDNCRNVEIKAKLADEKEFNEKVSIAKKLTGCESEILRQHDVFFKVAEGRLKLRYENGKAPKLIQYSRDNVSGPKLSSFDILEVKEGELLEKMLHASVGELSLYG